MAKRFTTRGVSKHRSYTLEEAALIIGACKQTVSQWGASGALKIMTGRKPYMVHGADLIAYLESRRPKKRAPLANGEFDCMSCKTRGKPYGMMADCNALTPKTSRLAALCGHCERKVSTIVGKARLAQYSTILEIANRDAP